MKKNFLIEKNSGTVYAVCDSKIQFSSERLDIVEIDAKEQDLDDVLKNKPVKVESKLLKFN